MRTALLVTATIWLIQSVSSNMYAAALADQSGANQGVETVKADVSGILIDAVTAYDKKQIEKAQGLFRKVLEVDPSNADANFSLGCIAEDRGDLLNAQKYYLKAHDAKPNDDEITESIKNIKAKTEQQAHPQQAISDDVTKAEADYKAGNYGAAKKALIQILSISPKNDRAHFALGECLRHLGDTRGASAHMKEALRLKPDNRYYKQGLAMLNSGDAIFAPRDPSRQLGEIIPIDMPGSAVPRRVDSVSWEVRNLVVQSRNMIDGVLSFEQSGGPTTVNELKAKLSSLRHMSPDPAAKASDESSTYHARGNHEAKQGLLGDALADYRKAFSLNPWDANETLDLVQLEIDNQQWAVAEQHCMAAIGCEPQMVAGWLNLGVIFANEHKYQKARSCFDIANMQSDGSLEPSKYLETALSKTNDSAIQDVLEKSLRQAQICQRVCSIGIKYLPNPDVPDTSMLAYRTNLLIQLADKWQAKPRSETILVVTINKDGKLTDNELVKSSGDKESDDHAVQAIKSISIPPLPDWCSDQQRQLIINFEKVNRLAQTTMQ